MSYLLSFGSTVEATTALHGLSLNEGAGCALPAADDVLPTDGCWRLTLTAESGGHVELLHHTIVPNTWLKPAPECLSRRLDALTKSAVTSITGTATAISKSWHSFQYTSCPMDTGGTVHVRLLELSCSYNAEDADVAAREMRAMSLSFAVNVTASKTFGEETMETTNSFDGHRYPYRRRRVAATAPSATRDQTVAAASAAEELVRQADCVDCCANLELMKSITHNGYASPFRGGTATHAVVSGNGNLSLAMLLGIHSSVATTCTDVLVQLALVADRGDVFTVAETASPLCGGPLTAASGRPLTACRIGPLSTTGIASVLQNIMYRPMDAVHDFVDVITVTLNHLPIAAMDRAPFPAVPTELCNASMPRVRCAQQRLLLRVNVTDAHVSPRIFWKANASTFLLGEFHGFTVISNIKLLASNSMDFASRYDLIVSMPLAGCTIVFSQALVARISLHRYFESHNTTTLALRGRLDELNRAVNGLRVRPPQRFVGAVNVSVRLAPMDEPDRMGIFRQKLHSPLSQLTLRLTIAEPGLPPDVRFERVGKDNTVFMFADSQMIMPSIIVIVPYTAAVSEPIYRIRMTAKHGKLFPRVPGNVSWIWDGGLNFLGTAATLAAAIDGSTFTPRSRWNSAQGSAYAADYIGKFSQLRTLTGGTPLPSLARVSIEVWCASATDIFGDQQLRLHEFPAVSINVVALDIVVVPVPMGPKLVLQDAGPLTTWQRTPLRLSGMRVVGGDDISEIDVDYDLTILHALCARRTYDDHSTNVDAKAAVASLAVRMFVCSSKPAQPVTYVMAVVALHGTVQHAIGTASESLESSELQTGIITTTSRIRQAINNNGLTYFPENNFTGKDTILVCTSVRTATAPSTCTAATSALTVALVVKPLPTCRALHVRLSKYALGLLRMRQGGELHLPADSIAVDIGESKGGGDFDVDLVVFARHGAHMRLTANSSVSCTGHSWKTGDVDRGFMVLCMRGSIVILTSTLASSVITLVPSPEFNSRDGGGLEELSIRITATLGATCDKASNVATIVLDVTPRDAGLHIAVAPDDTMRLVSTGEGRPLHLRGVRLTYVREYGDLDDVTISVTLTVSHGSLKLMAWDMTSNFVGDSNIVVLSGGTANSTLRLEGTTLGSLNYALAGVVYFSAPCFVGDDTLLVTAITFAMRTSASLAIRVDAVPMPPRWRIPDAAATIYVALGHTADINGIAIIDKCSTEETLYEMRAKAGAASLGVLVVSGIRVAVISENARSEDATNVSVNSDTGSSFLYGAVVTTSYMMLVPSRGAVFFGSLSQVNTVLATISYVPHSSTKHDNVVLSVRVSKTMNTDLGERGSLETVVLRVIRTVQTSMPPLILIPGAIYAEAPCHASRHGPPATRCGALLSVPRRIVNEGGSLAVDDVVIVRSDVNDDSDSLLHVYIESHGGTLLLESTRDVLRWIQGRDGGDVLSFECALSQCTTALAFLVFRSARSELGAAAAVTICVTFIGLPNITQSSTARIPITVTVLPVVHFQLRTTNQFKNEKHMPLTVDCANGWGTMNAGIKVVTIDGDADALHSTHMVRVSLSASRGTAAPPGQLPHTAEEFSDDVSHHFNLHHDPPRQDDGAGNRTTTFVSGTLSEVNAALELVRYVPNDLQWDGLDDIVFSVSGISPFGDLGPASDSFILIVRVAVPLNRLPSTHSTQSNSDSSLQHDVLPVILRVPLDAARSGTPRVFTLEIGGWVVIGEPQWNTNGDGDIIHHQMLDNNALVKSKSAAIFIDDSPDVAALRFVIELGTLYRKGQVGIPALEALVGSGDVMLLPLLHKEDSADADGTTPDRADVQFRILSNITASNVLLSTLTFAGMPHANGSDSIWVKVTELAGQHRSATAYIPIYIAVSTATPLYLQKQV